MSDLIAAPVGAGAPACVLSRGPTPGASAPDILAFSGHRGHGPGADDIGASAAAEPSLIEGGGDHIGGAAEGSISPHGVVSDNRRSWTPDPTGAARSVPVVIGHRDSSSPLLAELGSDPLDDLAAGFAAASKSEATRRAYLSDLRNFQAWCRVDKVCALPATPRTIARYVTHLAGLGRSVATINRRAAAIAYAHRLAGHDAPSATEEVRAVLTGIRNTIGRRPAKKKALTADLVAQVVKRIPSDLVGLRDRAMILLAFGGAFRRSELMALDIDHLEQHRRGLLVRLGKTKTDQRGQGRTVAVLSGKLKAPEAVAAWLAASGITAGPLFRGCDRGALSADRLSDRQFARVLKARCAAVGMDPDLIGGHSPRRGFATSAGDAGADLRHTARHMRHAKLETTLGYMEDGDLFRESAGRGFM